MGDEEKGKKSCPKKGDLPKSDSKSKSVKSTQSTSKPGTSVPLQSSSFGTKTSSLFSHSQVAAQFNEPSTDTEVISPQLPHEKIFNVVNTYPQQERNKPKIDYRMEDVRKKTETKKSKRENVLERQDAVQRAIPGSSKSPDFPESNTQTVTTKKFLDTQQEGLAFRLCNAGLVNLPGRAIQSEVSSSSDCSNKKRLADSFELKESEIASGSRPVEKVITEQPKRAKMVVPKLEPKKDTEETERTAKAKKSKIKELCNNM